jgi:hypothetical protein
MILLLGRALAVACRGHRELVLENIALRQQLTALTPSVARPRLRQRDRLFWIALAAIWRQWRSALLLGPAGEGTLSFDWHTNFCRLDHSTNVGGGFDALLLVESNAFRLDAGASDLLQHAPHGRRIDPRRSRSMSAVVNPSGRGCDPGRLDHSYTADSVRHYFVRSATPPIEEGLVRMGAVRYDARRCRTARRRLNCGGC